MSTMIRRIPPVLIGFCFSLLIGVATPAPAAPGDPVPIAAPFSATVLAEGLDAPWELLWGPDDQLWVTERQGARISRIDPASGAKTVLATIDGVHVGPQHEGLLGLAFGPGMQADGGQVFTTYTYKDGSGEWQRVVRFDYDGKALNAMTTILDRIPAGDDHQGGRLLFLPDGTLLLSKGELGHNQGGNFCKPIEAQRLPTAEETARGDRAAYLGKILRMNADGTIPADNPRLNGVVSHVYTYGHRNPQGLALAGGPAGPHSGAGDEAPTISSASSPSSSPGISQAGSKAGSQAESPAGAPTGGPAAPVLYASEHGPSSDDEINILVPGGNYGWPHVAGFQDDNGYVYANYSAAPDCPRLKYDANVIPPGVPRQRESEWQTPDDFQPPVKTFYTVRADYDFHDQRCAGEAAYLCWRPSPRPGSRITPNTAPSPAGATPCW